MKKDIKGRIKKLNGEIMFGNVISGLGFVMIVISNFLLDRILLTISCTLFLVGFIWIIENRILFNSWMLLRLDRRQ